MTGYLTRDGNVSGDYQWDLLVEDGSRYKFFTRSFKYQTAIDYSKKKFPYLDIEFIEKPWDNTNFQRSKKYYEAIHEIPYSGKVD